MLVSSIARMQAIQGRNQAQWNIMNNYMAMGSMMHGNSHGAFGGISMQTLHAIDTKMQMDLENNKIMALFYSLWEKSLRQQQQQEINEFFGNNLDIKA